MHARASFLYLDDTLRSCHVVDELDVERPVDVREERKKEGRRRSQGSYIKRHAEAIVASSTLHIRSIAWTMDGAIGYIDYIPFLESILVVYLRSVQFDGDVNITQSTGEHIRPDGISEMDFEPHTHTAVEGIHACGQCEWRY